MLLRQQPLNSFPYTTLFRSRPTWHGPQTTPGISAPASALGVTTQNRRSGMLGSGFPKLSAADRACCMRLVCSRPTPTQERSEEHTSELQSRQYLVCRLLLEK